MRWRLLVLPVFWCGEDYLLVLPSKEKSSPVVVNFLCYFYFSFLIFTRRISDGFVRLFVFVCLSVVVLCSFCVVYADG